MGLVVSHLSVDIGGMPILDDVSIDVRSGEFFSLLGSSGCGKSTLLKTIAGLTQEKEGEIILDDKKLHCLPPQQRGLVIMFQDKRLFSNMDVAENVAFALRNKGVRKKQRRFMAEKYLEMVQLGGFGDRRVHELSGGQQQRVALARVLCAEPRVLLLDEPFSALDENLRDDMRLLVKKIHDETGITTIMVTHDQHEALSLSDRIAVMNKGRITQVGTPAEVYEQPASLYIAEYFADGDMLEGEVVDGTFSGEDVAFEVDCEDGSAIAIVRNMFVSPDENGMEFTVESLQYRGGDMLAILRHGDFTLRFAYDLEADVKVGRKVRMGIDWQRALVFPRREVPADMLVGKDADET